MSAYGSGNLIEGLAHRSSLSSIKYGRPSEPRHIILDQLWNPCSQRGASFRSRSVVWGKGCTYLQEGNHPRLGGPGSSTRWKWISGRRTRFPGLLQGGGPPLVECPCGVPLWRIIWGCVPDRSKRPFQGANVGTWPTVFEGRPWRWCLVPPPPRSLRICVHERIAAPQ